MLYISVLCIWSKANPLMHAGKAAAAVQLQNLSYRISVLADAYSAVSVLQGVSGPIRSLLMSVLALVKFVSVYTCSSGRALSHTLKLFCAVFDDQRNM